MGLRTRSGNLEVATDIYTKGDRVIAVVGVCHVADSLFWECLNRRIAGYENLGYEVQYEKVRNDLPEGAEVPKGTGKLYEQIADLTGLESQSTALLYKDHWRNTDITLSQWLEFGKPAYSLFEMLAEASESLDKIVEAGGRERVGKDIRAGLTIMPIARRFIPKNKERDAIVIDLRNVIAADAMLNAEGNVVSIWGAGHLKGIGEMLSEEGFKRESRVWSLAVSKKAPLLEEAVV